LGVTENSRVRGARRFFIVFLSGEELNGCYAG